MAVKNEKKETPVLIMNVVFNEGDAIVVEGAKPKIDTDILAIQLDRNYKVTGGKFDIPKNSKYFTLYFPLSSIKYFTMYQKEDK